MLEKIICAAIWYDDGFHHSCQPMNINSGFVVCGHRHHNCMVTAAILSDTKEYPHSGVNGFITTNNRFVNRREAYDIASKYMIVSNTNRSLYSEDLY